MAANIRVIVQLEIVVQVMIGVYKQIASLGWVIIAILSAYFQPRCQITSSSIGCRGGNSVFQLTVDVGDLPPRPAPLSTRPVI